MILYSTSFLIFDFRVVFFNFSKNLILFFFSIATSSCFIEATSSQISLQVLSRCQGSVLLLVFLWGSLFNLVFLSFLFHSAVFAMTASLHCPCN